MTSSTPLAKLDLKVGERHLVALTQLQGKPCQSRWAGDQLMFTLCDGRKMFVEPYAQARIDAAQLAPGEEFEISKLETTQGNRRVVSIEVRKIGARTVPPAPAPQGVTSANSQSVPLNHTPAPPQLPPQPVNGAGENAGAILSRCYTQAIDIALAATAYAETKGLRITPAFEDIRAMAATICITEQGRR